MNSGCIPLYVRNGGQGLAYAVLSYTSFLDAASSLEALEAMQGPLATI